MSVMGLHFHHNSLQLQIILWEMIEMIEIVLAGFISTYFTVILPGFQMLFVIMGSSL